VETVWPLIWPPLLVFSTPFPLNVSHPSSQPIAFVQEQEPPFVGDVSIDVVGRGLGDWVGHRSGRSLRSVVAVGTDSFRARFRRALNRGGSQRGADAIGVPRDKASGQRLVCSHERSCREGIALTLRIVGVFPRVWPMWSALRFS